MNTQLEQLTERAEKAEALLKHTQFEFLEADKAREKAEAACAEMKSAIYSIAYLSTTHPQLWNNLLTKALSSDCGRGHIPVSELDRTKKVGTALIQLVEGCLGRRWTDGSCRLVDTKEWCEFYVHFTRLETLRKESK